MGLLALTGNLDHIVGINDMVILCLRYYSDLRFALTGFPVGFPILRWGKQQGRKDEGLFHGLPFLWFYSNKSFNIFQPVNCSL